MGHGATIINGQMNNLGFSSGSSGWAILADGSCEFNDGNFRGDITGATGTFSGGLSIGSGFKVDTNGNVWWGAASSYATATNKISSSGEVTFTTGSINIGSGAFIVTTGGAVTMTSATVTGGITAAGGSSLPATYFASGTIPAGVTISMTDNLNVSIQSGDFLTGSDGWAIFGDGSCEFNNITARGVVKTASSGVRVEMGSTAVGEIQFYGTAGAFAGKLLSIGTTFFIGAEDLSGHSSIWFESDSGGGDINYYAVTDHVFTGARHFDVDVSGNVSLDHGGGDTFILQENGVTYLTMDGDGSGNATLAGAANVTLTGTDITLDAASSVLLKDSGTQTGSFSSTAIDLDATTVTLDGTTIVLDGTTDVTIKDNGTTYANFDYLSGAARLVLSCAPTTAQGAQIQLEDGSGGGNNQLQLDNYVVSGNDYMRIVGGTTVMARFRLDTRVYALNVTGRAMQVNSNDTIGCDTSSTLRVKKNIQDLDLAELRSRARNLRVTSFEFDKEKVERLGIGEYEDDIYGKPHLGHIAEEVHEIFPEATYDWVNPDGTIDGYNDRAMLAILWGLWQDAEQRLTALEAA